MNSTLAEDRLVYTLTHGEWSYAQSMPDTGSHHELSCRRTQQLAQHATGSRWVRCLSLVIGLFLQLSGCSGEFPEAAERALFDSGAQWDAAIAFDGAYNPIDALLERDASTDVMMPEIQVGPAPIMTEFMARNRATRFDEDGDSSDWIELYNPHAVEVQLGQFALSDQDDVADPWAFPEMTLAPYAYVVVWASGKDRRNIADPLHTHFKLSSEGEPLTLVDLRGRIIQSFPAVFHQVDRSYGLMAHPLVPTGQMVRMEPEGLEGTDWRERDYDDSDWPAGAMGIGYAGENDTLLLPDRADTLQAAWSFEDAMDQRVPDESPGGEHPGVLAEGARLSEIGAGRNGGRAWAGTGRGWMGVEQPEGFNFAEDFTWSIWFKGPDNSGALISRNPAGTSWNRGSKALFIRNGQVQWDSGWVGNPNTGVRVTDNVWHHAAVTYQTADDVFRMYVDGQLAVDTRFNVNAFEEDRNDQGGRAQTGLFIGQAWFSGGLSNLDHYEGLIDDVTLWSAALEPAEIMTLFEADTLRTAGPLSRLITTERVHTGGGRLRIPFDVAETVDALALKAQYDDGFIAWLNGHPATLANAELNEDFATAARDDEQAARVEEHDLTAVRSHLEIGTNILAIQAMAAEDDPDQWLFSGSLWALSRSKHGPLAEPTPGAFNAPGTSPDVTFSRPSGAFSQAFELTMATDDDTAAIYFTTDGTVPTQESARYDGPIAIERPGVITARSVSPGRSPGAVARAHFVAISPELRQFSSELPVIMLDRLGQGEVPREAYGDGLFLSFEPGMDGQTDVTAEPSHLSDLGIRIRGQSSANAPKKPYRIELRDPLGEDLNLALLGMPADADWVLHGPFTDKSLVRNRLIYDLGRAIGISAPRSRFCELYVNEDNGVLGPEDYRGVYLLVERIEIGADRVNIQQLKPGDLDEPAVTGGYLMKFEADVAEPPLVPGFDTLELVDPSAPEPAQLAWIGAHIQQFQDILQGMNFADPASGYPAWIEVGSFIDLMVINELSRDQDAYVRSAYLYKDREGPLVMGPLWDYNLIAGTGGYFENTETAGWQWEHQYNRGEHGWFYRLMTDPEFSSRFALRWHELRDGVLSDQMIQTLIEGYVTELGTAAERNFELWDNLDTDSVNGFVSPRSATWREQIEQLISWLETRSGWIDLQLRRPD